MNKLVNREDNTAPATDFLQLLVDLATKAAAAHRHQHMRKAAIGLEVERISSRSGHCVRHRSPSPLAPAQADLRSGPGLDFGTKLARQGPRPSAHAR